MKKSLLFASLALAACIASAGSMSVISQSPTASKYEPPGMKPVVTSADAGYQKAHLRCLVQNPCTGIPDRPYLSASAVSKLHVATLPNFGIDGGSTKKAGQFTVGGQYVVGAHLSPTWDGRVHT